MASALRLFLSREKVQNHSEETSGINMNNTVIELNPVRLRML